MKLNRTIPFEFEGKSYEIRIYSKGWKFNIRAYKDDSPANGYSYTVDLPTSFDIKSILNIDAIQELVKLTKKDIENKKWEKLVNQYLKTVKTSADKKLGCQNCTSREIKAMVVDGRRMFECSACGNIWYEHVTSCLTGEYILHEITTNVEKEGQHEEFTEILLNGTFSEDLSKGLSFEDQLANWANINKLEYSFFYKKDAFGKERQAIRFFSKVPRVSPAFYG